MKSSTRKKMKTRILVFTQDIVVCSVRVIWFLGSIDLVTARLTKEVFLN